MKIFFALTLLFLTATSEIAAHELAFCTTRSACDGALKSDFLEMLKEMFHIETCVESGTYLGQTALNASKVFREVHTIELSARLHTQAKMHLYQAKNVFCYLGDSAKLLPQILSKINSPTLFYLDGHFSGGLTAQGSANTPVLEELRAIYESKIADGCILIDDLKCFQDSLYPNKIKELGLTGYPTLKEIKDLLLHINPNYQITFLGDALFAFPKNPEIVLSPLLESTTLHRHATFFEDVAEVSLKKADELVSHATGRELEELAHYYHLHAPCELELGYRSFATVWFALLLKHHFCEKEGERLLQIAAEKSPSGWIIERYCNQ